MQLTPLDMVILVGIALGCFVCMGVGYIGGRQR